MELHDVRKLDNYEYILHELYTHRMYSSSSTVGLIKLRTMRWRVTYIWGHTGRNIDDIIRETAFEVVD
jgi:hypothetical protein